MMKIVKRSIVGFDKLKVRELLLNYPFKKFQQQFQGINKELLADFFVEGFLSKAESTQYFEVVKFGQLLAVFVVEPLLKHSKIYSKRMFRISTIINYREPEICFNLFLGEIENLVKREKIEHISCRVDASDHQNISLLCEKGFRFCGTSIKMVLKSEAAKLTGFPQVRIAQPSDIESISAITAEHTMNQYYHDPFLPNERSKELFSRWLTEAVLNQKVNDVVYVLEGKHDLKIKAFASYKEPKRFNESLCKKIITLDMLVVREECRGRGYGRYLFETTLTGFSDYEQVELRVINDNYPALCFYQQLDFKPVSADVWLSQAFKQAHLV